MEKKTLIIISFALLVVAYFLHDYQTGKKQERIEKFAKEEREREIALQDSLNSLRPMSPELQEEVERYIDAHADIKVAGYENLRRLYYIALSKDGDKDIVTLMSGHGINESRMKGYTRLGRELIILYDDGNIEKSSLLDRDKLLTSTDQLSYYANQLENKGDTLFFVRKLEVVHNDTVDVLRPVK